MEFEKELKELINRSCEENKSDTPDFILTEYLVHCLNAFNKGIKSRDKFYGREPSSNITDVGSN